MPDKSKTSKALNEDFKVKYGIGESSGKLYSDTFWFGNANCDDKLSLKTPIVFGAAENTYDGDQGILGLGFKRSDERASSIFDVAVKEGLMTKPIFTIVYRSCPDKQEECDSAGLVTFGQIDSNCGPEIGSVNINKFSLQWEFQVDQISSGHYKQELNVEFISDSGASHLFLPLDVVENLMKMIGAKEEDSNYIISCKSRWQINFRINGQDYFVRSSVLLMNYGNDRCEIAIR
jgi:hypothetical protein